MYKVIIFLLVTLIYGQTSVIAPAPYSKQQYILNSGSDRTIIESIDRFASSEYLYSQCTREYGLSTNEAVLNAHKFLINFSGFRQDFSRLMMTWDRLSAGSDIFLRMFLIELKNCNQLVTTLQGKANDLSTSITKLSAEVQAAKKESQAKIIAYNVAISEAKQKIRTANIQIHNLQAKLSGASGFLQGFLTGITAGAYQGIEDDIRNQHNLINSINSNMANIRQNHQMEINEQAALNQLEQLLSNMKPIASNIASLKNNINRVLSQVQAEDVANSISNPAKNINIIKMLVSPYMNQLRKWESPN